VALAVVSTDLADSAFKKPEQTTRPTIKRMI